MTNHANEADGDWPKLTPPTHVTMPTKNRLRRSLLPPDVDPMLVPDMTVVHPNKDRLKVDQAPVTQRIPQLRVLRHSTAIAAGLALLFGLFSLFAPSDADVEVSTSSAARPQPMPTSAPLAALHPQPLRHHPKHLNAASPADFAVIRLAPALAAPPLETRGAVLVALTRKDASTFDTETVNPSLLLPARADASIAMRHVNEPPSNAPLLNRIWERLEDQPIGGLVAEVSEWGGKARALETASVQTVKQTGDEIQAQWSKIWSERIAETALEDRLESLLYKFNNRKANAIEKNL